MPGVMNLGAGWRGRSGIARLLSTKTRERSRCSSTEQRCADQYRPSTGAIDLTKADRAERERQARFMGDHKGGRLRYSRGLARSWLQRSTQSQSEAECRSPDTVGQRHGHCPPPVGKVDHRLWNRTDGNRGRTLSRRHSNTSQRMCCPALANRRRHDDRRYWWRHVEAATEDVAALAGLSSLHRHPDALPSIASSFGCAAPVLPGHSTHRHCPRRRHHLRHSALPLSTNSGPSASGGWHGVGNDPVHALDSRFETFPFPEGLTPNIPAADYAADPRAQAIATAAAELNRLREAWLNPPDLVNIVPEVVPGYPDRILPEGRQGGGDPEEAHPHQSLQRAAGLARQRPSPTSTAPSPPPTAGRPIFPTSKFSNGCSPSTRSAPRPGDRQGHTVFILPMRRVIWRARRSARRRMRSLNSQPNKSSRRRAASPPTHCRSSMPRATDRAIDAVPFDKEPSCAHPTVKPI